MGKAAKYRSVVGRETEHLNAALRRFNDVLPTLADRDYLMAQIAYETAPTLSGIKPSSLVTFCRHARNSGHIWRKYRGELVRTLELDYCELKKTDDYTLVLFYNRGILAPIIAAADTQAFLGDLGYEAGITLDKMLPILQIRLQGDAFPHELGLLLGIPKADVISFIENQGAGCLFCGYWKVYNRPGWARSMFRQYDAAKLRVLRSICLSKSQMAAPAS
jgi:hypothetical protein